MSAAVRAGYKQSEVGVIPEDWKVTPLSELAELTSSKRIFEGDYVPFGIPFFRGKEISMLVAGDSIDDPCFISEARFTSIKNRFGAPSRGDILITAVGTLGNVYVVDTDVPFYFKDGNLIWLRNIVGIAPNFLGIQLRRAKSAILDGAIGSSQKALTMVVLRKLPIPTPPPTEQRAIATALSDVDALLAKLDALIAKKRDLKVATMQQLLTGQTRLPGFSGEWEVKRLGDICEIGMGRTPPRLNQAYWGRGYKWLSIADLHTKIVSESKEEVTELAASMMAIIPKGTLLMSFKLSLGRLCFAGCDLFTNEAICSFNKLQAIPEFLYYVLGRTDFSLYGKQAVKGYTLNKQSLKLVEVPFPPLPEQIAIATVLSDMDAELTALEARRDKTRALKQAMMQELLTGRIRLI